MLLYKAFEDVAVEFRFLRTSLLALEEVVTESAAMSASARELAVLLEDGIRSAERGRNSVKAANSSVDVARRVLPRCQRDFNEVMARFRTELDAPEPVKQFEGAARDEVLYRLGLSRQPLFAAGRALSFCWATMAHHAALSPGGVLPFAPPP